MADAYYLPTGPGTYLATELTEGPWSPGAQHGGPPCALLVRTLDHVPSTIPGPSRIAKVSFDILGPVPVAELSTRGSVLRPGRSVELVQAELVADGRPVLRASAWRIRESEPLAIPTPVATPIKGPDGIEAWTPTWGGYSASAEWRFVDGGFAQGGPASVWGRLRVPVVAGEDPTPLQRVAAFADSGNGLSATLDMRAWWYINTELTLHLFRFPDGDWVHISAETSLDPAGVGVATTVLSDQRGRIGHGAQALLVGPR
jgi:Thioesterase-like superfamily